MHPAPEKKLAHQLLPPEKYFRWRAGEITRLEAFSDVVFGFAITLLVVSLEVPHNYEELIADMRGFLPFAVCFAQLVLIWYEHYRFARRYGLEDAFTVFLNVTLLFVVLFYVYPLKFLFSALLARIAGIPGPGFTTDHDASVLMQVYACGWTAVFLLFTLLYRHAYSQRAKLELDPVETYSTRVSIQQNAGNMLIGVIAFTLAIWSPAWSGWAYMLVGAFSWIHGSVTGKRTRLQAEKLAAPSKVAVAVPTKN